MLTDQNGLALPTQSVAARNAFVSACDEAVTFHTDATVAFDRAIAVDPGFAMVQASKVQVLLCEGNTLAARHGGQIWRSHFTSPGLGDYS